MSERTGGRRWAAWMVLLAALVGSWSAVARADALCGGGGDDDDEQHLPPTAPSSSSSSGTSNGGPTSGGSVGLRRPCSGGQPIPFGATDLGMMAGMVVLGGGAAVSSRGRTRKS